MWKNLIIGILFLLLISFFFYGLTQQIKAEQAMDQYRRLEAVSLKLKEALDSVKGEAFKQAEFSRQQFDRAEKARGEAERLLAESKKKNK